MSIIGLRLSFLHRAICVVGFVFGFPEFAPCQELRNNLQRTTAVLKWSVPLGWSSGSAAVSEQYILVGTNRNNPTLDQDSGVILCLNHEGVAIWRAIHARMNCRVNDIPGMGIKTRPAISDGRVYYYSNRGEIICADLDGFRDGVNDGPFAAETGKSAGDVDYVWKVDLIADHGVFKRDASDACNPLPSVVVDSQYVYCMTGNGSLYANVAAGTELVPAPTAPSIVAIDRNTGSVEWKNSAPGKRIMYGQWGTPALVVESSGVAAVVFPGGDGFLHSVNSQTGDTNWSVDLNDPEASHWGPGRGTRGFCSAKPLVWNNLIIVGTGQDAETSPAISFPVVAVNTNGKRVWSFRSKHLDSCLGAVAVKEKTVFVLATNGNLFAIDAETGTELSRVYLGDSAALFSSPIIDGDSVFVATESEVYEFSADKKLQKRSGYEFTGIIQGSPTIYGQTMYVTTSKALFALPTRTRSNLGK